LDAVRSLSDSIGQDLGELAAAASQLIADTEGTISVEIVEKYYGGRVQATSFKVADAALDGQLGSAIALLRHALATGVQPVAITASFALKARRWHGLSTQKWPLDKSPQRWVWPRGKPNVWLLQRGIGPR